MKKRKAILIEGALAYAAAGLSLAASFSIIILFGSATRGEFAYIFGIASLICSLAVFVAAESSARSGTIGRRDIQNFALVGALLGTCAAAWIYYTNRFGPSLPGASLIITWCAISVVGSQYAGVFKSLGSNHWLNLGRLSLALISCIGLILGHLLAQNVWMVLFAYTLANLSSVIMSHRGYKRLTESLIGLKHKPSVLMEGEDHIGRTYGWRLILAGILTSASANIESLLAPTIASFEELGWYATFKTIIMAASPAAGLIATRYYAESKLKDSIGVALRTRDVVVVFAVVLVMGLAILVVQPLISAKTHSAGPGSIWVAIVSLSLGAGLSFLATWLEEALKSKGKFSVVSASLILGLVASILATPLVAGITGLAIVYLVGAATRFCFLWWIARSGKNARLL